MTTPSPSVTAPPRDERRVSDQGIARVAPNEQQRRRTIGSAPVTMNADALSTSTPSKHRLHLGSAAASAYYFSDLPKTPHSVAKSTHRMEESKADDDTTRNLAETSMLSVGTSSSDGSDLLNRSVLSDTTELTASNFVLAASSRQRMSELSRFSHKGVGSSAAANDENVQSIGGSAFSKGNVSNATRSREPLTPANGSDVVSPFTQKRKNAASLDAWKKLASRIEKEDMRRRTSFGTQHEDEPLPLPSLTPTSARSKTSTIVNEGGPLDTTNTSLRELLESVALSKPSPSGSDGARQESPSSTIASVTDRPGTPHSNVISHAVSKTQSVEEHPSSPLGSPVRSRIRPSPSSHEKRLTPTKLSPKPQRVVNPESVDSPARNTRSAAKKKGNSPIGLMHRVPKPDGKRKRIDMPTEEIAGTVTFSARDTGGRVSDISMGPFEKRHRNSMGSTSTASLEDVNLLLELAESSTAKGLPRLSLKSPSPTIGTSTMAPRSILNSSRTDRSAHRKAVVFTSPEAAEYRIGSPSVSLTPMLKGDVKAMFSIPDPNSSAESSEDVAMEDMTAEIEADLGALIQNVGKGENNFSETEGIDMVVGEDDVSNDIPEDDTTGIQRAVAEVLLDVQSSSSGSASKDDTTVELEPSIQGLLNTTTENEPNIASNPSGTTATAPDDESMQVSPAQPAKVAGITDGDGTVTDMEKKHVAIPDSAQFDTSNMTTDSSPPSGEDEDNTVELEASLTTLLATSGIEKASSFREAPAPSRLSDKFPKVQSGIVPSTNRMSFGDDTGPTSRLQMSDDNPATKELESDMGAVLEANLADSLPDKNVDQWEQETSSLPHTPSESRKRSHHRFSLTPSGRKSLLQESESDDMNVSIPLESAAPNLVADSIPMQDEPKEPMELTSADLFKAANLSLDTHEVIDARSHTVALDFDRFTKDITEPMIGDEVAGFFDAVCAEVEEKTMGYDAEAMLDSLVENKPDVLPRLQNGLRSGDPSNLKGRLQELGRAAAESVRSEWMSWEIQVAKSLSGAVEVVSDRIREEKERLDRCVSIVDEAQGLVSLAEGRAARKARRRSLKRRKDAAFSLEERIEKLKDQIAQAKQELEYVAEEESAVQSVLDMSTSKAIIDASRSKAETEQNRFTNLIALHSWKPRRLETSNFSVAVLGASPRTCVELSCAMSDVGAWKCEAKVNATYFGQRTGKALKVTPSTSRYLRAQVTGILESANESALASIDDARMLVRRIELSIGRIETTAKELSMLQRRYNARLEADPEGKATDFLFSVGFSSPGSDDILATFEFGQSYPFAPLYVSLDGEADADALRRQLLRNTKPGFGYLSRTCDIVAAFLRGAS